MTKKIYELDVYKKEHSAIILKIFEDKDIRVVLDETIFFPVGGGQSADKGTIDNIEVLNVIEEYGEIYHILSEKPKNKKVILKIDWEHRFDQMQQHCGEHILSGIIKSKYNGNNKGFHLGINYVSIDIDIEKITKEMIDDIEVLANDVIYKNIKLEITKLDHIDKTLEIPVRKKITVDEEIRIVNIPEVDCVACCGTHPSRTGDVGIIKIYKTEKNKKMTRIFFKCGKRALKDIRKKIDIINILNNNYSADDDTLIDRINTEKEKSDNIKKEYIKIKKFMIDEIIKKELFENEKYIDIIFDDLSSNDMNYAIKKISGIRNVILLIYSKSERKIILSYDGKKDLNCGLLFKDIKAFNAKGGGNKKVAQAVFDSNENGIKFYNKLKDIIK